MHSRERKLCWIELNCPFISNRFVKNIMRLSAKLNFFVMAIEKETNFFEFCQLTSILVK